MVLQLTVGDTAVEALAFNAGLRYLVIQVYTIPLRISNIHLHQNSGTLTSGLSMTPT